MGLGGSLVAFQLVQSGWGQPGLSGWGSVFDNTEAKGLEGFTFPPTPAVFSAMGDLNEHQHPFRVGGKDLSPVEIPLRTRHSQLNDVLKRYIRASRLHALNEHSSHDMCMRMT